MILWRRKNVVLNYFMQVVLVMMIISIFVRLWEERMEVIVSKNLLYSKTHFS